MKVAILGCGLIGASWAALFATVGRHEVQAWDPSPHARSTFAAKVKSASEHLIALGATAGSAVIVQETLEATLSEVDWIQENAPERVDLKLELYRQVESAVRVSAILATSTSSFTWSQLATGLLHPQRFVVAHPFNPPHLLRLVELYCPEEATLRLAVEFFEGVGRVPVCMKREATGHIGNRLASALWREAVNIVAEGFADVTDVDKVLIHGPGLRWSLIGTHLGYHLGGGAGGIESYLQHLGPSQERRWSSLGAPRLTPELCRRLIDGVQEEAAGRSIAQLEAQRDEQLIHILKLRLIHPTIDA